MLTTVLQFFAALLMAFVWAAYLRKINIFVKIRWYQVLISLVAGGLSTIPVLLIKVPEIPGLNDQHVYIQKLVFYIYDVALHEEFFKFAAFVLVCLAFMKWFREEPNFIIHASLVALGFATVENFIYFSHHGIHLIYMRGMMSTFSHMIDTTLVVTFLCIGLRKNIGIGILFSLFGLLVATVVHGLYNYFISLGYPLLFALTLLMFTIEIEVWSRIVNNFLNYTRNIDQKKSIDRNSLQNFLLIAFFTAGAIQLIGLLYEKGWVQGLVSNFRLLAQEVIITILLIIRITRFTIIPRYWQPVYPVLPITIRRDVVQRSIIPTSPRFFLKIRGDEFNEHPFTSMIGKDVDLESLPQKDIDFEISLRIKVLDKKFLGKNNRLYYLAEIIDFHTIDPQYNSRYILLRPKNYGKKRYKKMYIAGVIAMKGYTHLENIHPSDCKFIKWMAFKGEKKSFARKVKEFIL